MEKFNTEEKEIVSTFNIQKPISMELLYAGLGAESVFPSDLISNSRLQQETRKRIQLDNYLRELFAQTKETASISENISDIIYDKLADFIDDDPINNTRIILYLPFQLFPDLKTSNSESKQKFAKVLHDGWIRLLYESEVRASFVDGDDLEPGLGTPPRTRKAAHLIPEMLSRGIITEKEILDLLEICDDNELSKSLTEGLIVSKDKKMSTGPESKLTLDKIAIKLNRDISKIEREYAPKSKYTTGISNKRAVWEKGEKVDKVINHTADLLAKKVVSKEVTIESILEKFDDIITLRTLTKTALSFSEKDKKLAEKFVNRYFYIIRKLWEGRSPEQKDEVVTSVNYLQRSAILDKKISQEMSIRIPDLSLPFPIDINNFATEDGKVILDSAKKIHEHLFLSNKVFPFLLVFGSRLKGYSGLKTDFDFAIFIKPEVNWKEREQIISALRQDIPEIGNTDRLLEFWTETKNGSFGLRPVPENTENVIGAKQVHFIFGGVWLGYTNEMKNLYRDLAIRYLDLSRFGNQKEIVRRHLLRQIELDVLQYRLMHKGYQKFYPRQEITQSAKGELIDGESVFWDEGYRRIATLLFLNRVFLPDLSQY